jgi:hypothetical protein
LVAIAKVHSDNRLACVITLTLFATGIALSLLLIAAELLKQVIAKPLAALIASFTKRPVFDNVKASPLRRLRWHIRMKRRFRRGHHSTID